MDKVNRDETKNVDFECFESKNVDSKNVELKKDTAGHNILRVENLSKSFKSRTTAFDKPDYFNVLEDISFALKEEEIVALVGPSGCGKTTLLNI
ncbi:MAG: ATP-binding cassette domain-containing protein, partial [Halanaerobiales bacterium]